MIVRTLTSTTMRGRTRRQDMMLVRTSRGESSMKCLAISASAPLTKYGWLQHFLSSIARLVKRGPDFANNVRVRIGVSFRVWDGAGSSVGIT